MIFLSFRCAPANSRRLRAGGGGEWQGECVSGDVEWVPENLKLDRQALSVTRLTPNGEREARKRRGWPERRLVGVED
ncbi:hypothetical protein IEQ34_017299 [Dendrobium chrysotoxum]|uniref:Uncharacterized protein n=1 Tax=Dendrobium chrysotoxum TaxID=161865 RepID=A0AAV7GB47_DENCH|nr:hypothetical protein IEQ34_017299 [Dendrobium chrysotoxum]